MSKADKSLSSSCSGGYEERVFPRSGNYPPPPGHILNNFQGVGSTTIFWFTGNGKKKEKIFACHGRYVHTHTRMTSTHIYKHGLQLLL